MVGNNYDHHAIIAAGGSVGVYALRGKSVGGVQRLPEADQAQLNTDPIDDADMHDDDTSYTNGQIVHLLQTFYACSTSSLVLLA